MLQGKKVILGVTGSISAYKAVLLLRLLVQEGAEVQVIMTDRARDFVTELTFSTLSQRRVMSHLFENGNWENHALLGQWADIMVIAPASAHTLGKMANGLCDNLLLSVYLSATCPVLVAPAMDEAMWHHASVQRNVAMLSNAGVRFASVGTGALASGLTGAGRLAEPDEILLLIRSLLRPARGVLAGRKVLITSGPTHEPIDPVRYISNRSSGKMGAALADAFLNKGAAVTMVAGPSAVPVDPAVDLIPVQTAQEMYEAAIGHLPEADIIVMAAAVSDYRPAQPATEKLKKSEDKRSLSLVPNPDILMTAGKQKKDGQLLIGFALESENEKHNALAKLRKKNADFIILNSLREPGSGFGGDTNKVTIFAKDGSESAYALKSKEEVANDIVTFISMHL